MDSYRIISFRGLFRGLILPNIRSRFSRSTLVIAPINGDIVKYSMMKVSEVSSRLIIAGYLRYRVNGINGIIDSIDER